ncbi:MAG TPA: hypothetical protein VFA46_16290 [Actinomycetes bacterium]|nr:hypothetical protein [Actinomycetes bacterium]
MVLDPQRRVLHSFTAESAWSFLDASRELGVAGDSDLVALTALAAWRQTKGIYQFDPDLAREVVTTRLHDRLPVQVLKRLPAWCCYVASGEVIGPAAGFYVFLDWVVLTQQAALTFVFDLDPPDEGSLVMDWSVPLVEGGSAATVASTPTTASTRTATTASASTPTTTPTRPQPSVSGALATLREAIMAGERQGMIAPAAAGEVRRAVAQLAMAVQRSADSRGQSGSDQWSLGPGTPLVTSSTLARVAGPATGKRNDRQDD